jgi:hypothetical protein
LKKTFVASATGVPLDRSADDLLGRPVAIGVRGVPKRDAELDGLTEDRLGRVVVEGPLVESA